MLRWTALFFAASLPLFTGCAAPDDDLEDEDSEIDSAVSELAKRPVELAAANVAYGAPNDSTHRLDVYAPKGVDAKPRPLMVWVHGGAFASGSRRDPHLVALARYTASLGYVSVSIDYLLVNTNMDPKHPFPFPARAVTTAAGDARDAIQFLKEHADDYGIDPTRIAVGGASAGAITALHVAYGSTPENRDRSIRAVVDLWGAFQSSTGLQRGDAPLLVFHGTNDWHWMPYSQAERLRDSARDAGVPCVFRPLRGKSHGPWEGLDGYLTVIGPFLRKNLGPAL